MLGFNASDIDRWPRKLGLATFAKTAAAVAVISFAVVIIPYTASFAAAVILRLSVALRPWLAPPFLFAAVHLIILIIWKLSENKKYTDQFPQEPLTDKLGDLVPSTDTDISDSEVRKQQFNEYVTSIVKNTHVKVHVESMDVTVNNIKSMNDKVLTVKTDEDDDLIEGRMKATIIDEDEEEDDDSMDARWKAILQGGAAPVEKFILPEGGMQREVSEDCNQKFEAFIKRNYDQIRVAAKLGDG